MRLIQKSGIVVRGGRWYVGDADEWSAGGRNAKNVADAGVEEKLRRG